MREEDYHGGRACRWIQFKYERLPNFCYRCGLFGHALRDCSESMGSNYQVEDDHMLYGAWLKGEPSRRGGVELAK